MQFLSCFATALKLDCSLPGPPISNKTTAMELLQNNVVVGIGCRQIWEARNLPFDIAWVRSKDRNKTTTFDVVS